MIAAGLMRAIVRRPIWHLAIAGVAVAPIVLAAPALAGSTTGARAVTNCGSGISAVTVRLPARFDPLTATPAELAANDLPLRPACWGQLAAWRRFVTGGVRSAPATCSFAPVIPSSAPRSIVGDVQPASSQSIVGDVQPASSQSIVGDTSPVLSTLTPPATAPRPSAGGNRASAATRTVVYGTWRVTRPENAPDTAASSWAGIGPGQAGDPLIQAGSSAGGYFGPYLWWRMVPQRPNEQRISVDTAPGDTVYVRIALLRGRATVTIRDENTGAGGTYLVRY